MTIDKTLPAVDNFFAHDMQGLISIINRQRAVILEHNEKNFFSDTQIRILIHFQGNNIERKNNLFYREAHIDSNKFRPLVKAPLKENQHKS